MLQSLGWYKWPLVPGIKIHNLAEEHRLEDTKDSGKVAGGAMRSGYPKGNGLGLVELLTCQLVSGRPEICIRNMVRRGRGAAGRSVGPGKFSLRRGPRANCTVSRSPLKSLPSVGNLVSGSFVIGPARIMDIRKAARVFSMLIDSSGQQRLTRHDVTSIHSILIFNETEAIH